MDVLLLNGPNLNALGTREPEVYGTTTLAQIEEAAGMQAAAAGLELAAFQSNHEGALIDRLYQAKAEGVKYVIVNPGGFTHTSVALRDAFASVELPFIEVHLSNIHAREEFRHHSFLSDQATGVMVGFGAYGYTMAIDFVINRLGAWA
jgi:3-dehydroquinate dehydratase-2